MKIKVITLIMLTIFIRSVYAEISPKDEYTLLCITEKSSGLLWKNNDWINDSSGAGNKYIIKKISSKVSALDLSLNPEKAIDAMSDSQLLQYGSYLDEIVKHPRKVIQIPNLNSKLPRNCNKDPASFFSEGCFTIKEFGETESENKTQSCEEDWSYGSLKATLNEVMCKNHSDNWVFHPNGWFHKSTLSTVADWPYKKVNIEVGRCSTL